MSKSSGNAARWALLPERGTPPRPRDGPLLVARSRPIRASDWPMVLLKSAGNALRSRSGRRRRPHSRCASASRTRGRAARRRGPCAARARTTSGRRPGRRRRRAAWRTTRRSARRVAAAGVGEHVVLQRGGRPAGRGPADLGGVERQHDVGGQAVVLERLVVERPDHQVGVVVELTTEPAGAGVGPVVRGGCVRGARCGEQDGRDGDQRGGCEQPGAQGGTVWARWVLSRERSATDPREPRARSDDAPGTTTVVTCGGRRCGRRCVRAPPRIPRRNEWSRSRPSRCSDLPRDPGPPGAAYGCGSVPAFDRLPLQGRVCSCRR